MLGLLSRKTRNDYRTDATIEMGVESLEQRKMLAGDVSVIVRGDNLIIRGDNSDNSVSIYDEGGNVFVSGADTTLNGAEDAIDTGISSEEGIDSLVVQLRRGDDTIDISDVTIKKQARINTAVGNDDVSVNATFADRFVLATGGGDDSVYLGDATFGGNVVVNAGGGDDAVDVDGVILTGMSVRVSMGGGNDVLSLLDVGDIPSSDSIVLSGGGGSSDAFVDSFGFTPEDFELMGVKVRSFEVVGEVS